MNECVFCTLPAEVNLVENDLVRAFYDKYPVSEGHVLIVPKNHASSFFDATAEEMASVGELLKRVKDLLDERFQPDGYNIGANIGSTAGQTVFHWHIHVIPRYNGDIGTVRWHT
ncbi:HIT family protein [Desulfosporosinus meridiei]|uniref:HIT family hydrolase, diadenosine tetraphosphate hydrolase n=1 Tax=Desulfosporosinus meridiei (strain ATCC BAA-275 / DSM 13257 / KCTC 12902 / NCIMB 13706 / S10) TaxID=768704 RepID=J7IW45_DESMD|nr:HIT family protein [Desulfosporosinus meridiei]AFQ42926.1 HIT family hydrolase, diadenosine tetraphosphate hydrolase [Desulfosporosinus meridiei DSM 13257]